MEDWRTTTPKIELFSDGSADPNPGEGGYGIILRYNGRSKEFSEGFSLTTNNRMEILGVVRGLELLKTISEVEVYTDSSYVVNAVKDKWIEGWVNKNWKTSTGTPVQNTDLWKRLIAMLDKHTVHFNWIKGHAGHPENERCDQLAKAAYSDKSKLNNDDGYEPEKTKPLQVKKEGDLCKKCSAPVVKAIPKKRDPQKAYYFDYYLYCPNCHCMYMIEEAKHYYDKKNDGEINFG